MTNFYANFNIPKMYGAVAGNVNQTANPWVQRGAVPSINMGPASDVFQRSATPVQVQNAPQIQQIAPVSNVWDNKRIEAIYNKTFETVMAQNPITRELNITKPALDFSTEENRKEGALATYRAGANNIIVQDGEFFKSDLYLCKMTDKSGEIVDIRIFEEKYADEYSKKHPEFKITREKLTDSEKELYISSTFAHELRHCIQNHLIASTDGCADKYKKWCLDYKTALEELVASKKEMAALEGKAYAVCDEEKEIERLDYTLNYKPKKVFDKNTAFKYSLSPSDNRYWLVNDHLYTLSEEERAKDSLESYYTDPLEIDAYNYEREFVVTESKKYPNGTLRKEIVDGLFLSASLNVFDDNVLFIRK